MGRISSMAVCARNGELTATSKLSLCHDEDHVVGAGTIRVTVNVIHPGTTDERSRRCTRRRRRARVSLAKRSRTGCVWHSRWSHIALQSATSWLCCIPKAGLFRRSHRHRLWCRLCRAPVADHRHELAVHDIESVGSRGERLV